MKTIICDLDGTLCNIDHRLHYVKGEKKDFDSFYKACVDDTINSWCKEILLPFIQDKNMEIIFVSGRSDIVREETEKWVMSKLVAPQPPCTILMRKHGDYTPDDELKRQMYEEHLKDKDILFAIDDRARVVKMWRSLGLTVLQCAEGNF